MTSFSSMRYRKLVDEVAGRQSGHLSHACIYNTGMSIGDPTNLGNCCAGGYHSINPAGRITFQTTRRLTSMSADFSIFRRESFSTEKFKPRCARVPNFNGVRANVR